MPRLCVYIYIYIRLKGEEGKEESFQRFFHSISRYTRDTSLCAPGALGPSRMEEGGRGREENKYRATKGGENPSAHAGVPLLLLPFPPVCLTALAYGHECQCSSRKHDLGWNNPFGKGLRLSSFLYFLFFFSPLCLSLSALFDFLRAEHLSVQQQRFLQLCSRVLPRVHRACARSNLI